MCTRLRHWACLLGQLLLAAAPLGSRAALGQPSETRLCPDDIAPFATPFCAELVATPDLGQGVRGMLELHRVRSPFGVAVSREGLLRHRLVARLRGLPPPAALGAAVYVAWGYDVTMGRETKLGVVTNGATSLGELPYEHFRLIVSAESSRAVSTRKGRLVARATSPMALMLAHRDAVAPLMATMSPDGHAGHSAWPMPPADPRLSATPMAHSVPSTAAWLPGDAAGIPEARPREVLSPQHGDTLRLTATRVRRTIGGKRFVMYGYNGQYPGPLIRVHQSSEIVVRFHNAIDLPSTVHWHGLRLENASDGVPHLTQEPIAPGDSFTYRLRFPDAGLYWYHPHVREDIQQELGLYGNLLVAARRAQARVPVHREEILALDDMLLLDGGGPMPFGADTATHALMGRFGNTVLVNGEPGYRLTVRRGEVVRFYLTNVANARLFNLRIPGARLKLVGSDLGDYEREEWVPSVVIAPAERYVVEAYFERPGQFAMVNAVRWIDHMRGTAALVSDTLGIVAVDARSATPSFATEFRALRPSARAVAEFRPLRRLASRPVDHTLTLSLRLTGITPNVVAMLSGIAMPADWNDGMPSMNWPMTAREVGWLLRDETGRENMDIQWSFQQGEVTRVRIINDPASTHAMAHPFHIHGQRFVVLSRNGVPNDNMVWKDTALIPAGESMDIVLELSNPGVWMMHCHVAEHLGTGMMAAFKVTPVK